MPAGCSRRDFFRGESEPEQERLAMVLKRSSRVAHHLYYVLLTTSFYCVCRFDALPLPHVIAIDADRTRTEHGSILGERVDGDIASKMLWYNLWFYFTALLFSHSPRVQLRGTSIIGKHLREFNQDFFGGTSFHHSVFVY